MIDRNKNEAEISVFRDYFESFVFVFIFFIFTITFVLQQSKIPTGSMEDTILIGDRLIVNKFIYGPEPDFLNSFLPHSKVHRGDIIVFKFPGNPEVDYIKRVIGIGGDKIELKNKQLYRNGEKIKESYVKYTEKHTKDKYGFSSGSHDRRDNFGPFRVPEGTFFVMGDNRDNSNDSRYWGVVPKEYVKGRALLFLWSYKSKRGVAKSPEELFKRWYNYVTHFFSHTRWDRILRPVE